MLRDRGKFIRGFLRHAHMFSHHRPRERLIVMFNHINKGFIYMDTANLIPGGAITAVVGATDSLEQVLPPPSPPSATSSDSTIATVTPNPSSNDSFDITGVAVGSAVITFVSGGLSAEVDVIVSADAAVALTVTLGPMRAATPTPTPTPSPTMTPSPTILPGS